METKKPSISLMFDIETLGCTDNTTLIQLACVAFDIESGRTLSEFNEFIDISQGPVNADGATIKWWLQTDAELLKELVCRGTISEQAVFNIFNEWLTQLMEKHDVLVWGNGISFDVQIVKKKFQQYGLVWPVSFRNERDVRTLKDIYCIKKDIDHDEFKEMFSMPHLVKHNGLDDCKYQINYVVAIYNDLLGSFSSYSGIDTLLISRKA